jgi:hypothetical protein
MLIRLFVLKISCERHHTCSELKVRLVFRNKKLELIINSKD